MLALAGLGPSMLALGPRASRVAIAACAPLTGLALALLAATFAVQLDLPLHSCAWPLTAGLLASSALCALAALRLRGRTPDARAEASPPLRDYGLLFALAAALLLAPALIGGPRTTTLKGNLYDDLNYVIGARYVGAHPLSWQASESSAALVRTDPGLLLVKRFLWSERTPVLSLLAWSALLVARPVIEVEFAFTLVFFLLAVGPAYLLCLDLGVPPLVRFLAPLAVACGFWAQIVLDLRAMGQIVNLPLSLGLCWFAQRSLSGRSTAPPAGSVVLGSLLLCTAGLGYPEMVPSLAWGLAAALAWGAFGTRLARSTVRSWGLALLGALLLLTTQGVFFWRLLARQLYLSVVRGPAMDWQGDWFRFLQTPSPLAGHWGLAWGPLCASTAWRSASVSLASLLTLALALVLARVLVRAVRRNRTNVSPLAPSFVALATLAAFVSGFLVQDAVMHLVGNPWAGAKALSYGFPYFTLLMAGVLAWPRPKRRVPALLRPVLQGAILVWLLSQSAFALFRIVQSPEGATYFVYGEPFHRSSRSVGFDPDWRSFKTPLARTRGTVVWSFQPEVWESELFNVSFGRLTHLIPLLPIDHYWRNFLIDSPYAPSLPLPGYLLVNRHFWGDTLQPGQTIVHQTPHTRLLRLPSDQWRRPFLFGVFSPSSASLHRTPNEGNVSLPCEIWVYTPQPADLQLALSSQSPQLVVARSPRSARELWRGQVTPDHQPVIPLVRGLNVIQLALPHPAALQVLLKDVRWSQSARSEVLY